jgi:glutathione peroxidase
MLSLPGYGEKIKNEHYSDTKGQSIMKKLFYIFLFIFPLIAWSACDDLYNHKLTTLQGENFNLCEHRNKPIIFVNTASKCGFTSQFEGLEKLYSQNKDRLLIVGFPSNDFNQELKTDKEIQDFCKLTYAVEFPMMSKSSVVGIKANPIYKILYERTGEAPMWNFYKFVVAPDAKKINVFPSTVSPESDEFLGTLKPYLNN